MTIATLDEVLTLATRLDPADKLRLVERLMPQVVSVVEPIHRASEDVWERLQQFQDASLNYPLSVMPGDVLDADRRERDAALMGNMTTNVHA